MHVADVPLFGADSGRGLLDVREAENASARGPGAVPLPGSRPISAQPHRKVPQRMVTAQPMPNLPCPDPGETQGQR